MDPRQERRVAENESLFRGANEVAAHAIDGFEPGGDSYQLVCECPVTNCEDGLELTRAQYREVRTNARWFVVLPGHVVGAVEHVVADRGAYWIVEKTGECGAIAEGLAAAPPAP
ncbi:MAG: hypothetical protein JWM86_1007 [Thermoleophilia bacterium]|nr:hypothetical protein [Thermoleophilia bacterium]